MKLTHRDIDATPFERVRIANELAISASRDAPLRKLASVLVEGSWDIPRGGPGKIARWIRKAFHYTLETPGIEVLQGPYTTLYTRTVDCDDAVILWQTLTRAIGLRTYFTGVGVEPNELVHAVGYDPATGILYELIDDMAYSGHWKLGIRFRLPSEAYAVYWSPEPESEGFYMATAESGAFQRVE